MGIDKPYHRNYRDIKKASNSGYSGWAYIIDREYAINPGHFVRAYQLIQRDLQQLFEYIEPSPESLATFSYRIHNLLMRTCIEIEANFKAILNENIYTPQTDRNNNPIYNISVYKKIDVSHHLSSYELALPIWNGSAKVFTPFRSWKDNQPLDWYQAYNASKHDRHEAFKKANMGHLLNAVTGLLVLLSAQFKAEDFSAGSRGLAIGYDYHEGDVAIGGLFRITFPKNWSENEMYDFNWSELEKKQERFQKINYDKL